MAAFNDKYVKYNCKDDGHTSTKKYIKNITSYLGNIIRASDEWKIICQEKLTLILQKTVVTVTYTF